MLCWREVDTGWVASWQRTLEDFLTLYFRGKKISRKANLKYGCIFARRYFREYTVHAKISSRENIFPRKYLLAKISSRENIFPRKYPPAKIVCLFHQRSFLFAVCCTVIGDTGSRPKARFILLTPSVSDKILPPAPAAGGSCRRLSRADQTKKVWTLQRRRRSLPAYELKLPWVVMKSVTFVRCWVKNGRLVQWRW